MSEKCSSQERAICCRVFPVKEILAYMIIYYMNLYDMILHKVPQLLYGYQISINQAYVFQESKNEEKHVGRTKDGMMGSNLKSVCPGIARCLQIQRFGLVKTVGAQCCILWPTMCARCLGFIVQALKPH